MLAENAYFTRLEVSDISCFDGRQVLELCGADGKTPKRWTIILGDNGVGKTTLLQLLALGEVLPAQDPSPGAIPNARPKFSMSWYLHAHRLLRLQKVRAQAAYGLAWAEALGTQANAKQERIEVFGEAHMTRFASVFGGARSTVYGYGANRRRAPNGLTADVNRDTSLTLFDDEATLRNPEEWFLQNELVAVSPSAHQAEAAKSRDAIRSLLSRVLPGVSDVRIGSASDGRGNFRAVLEVNSRDGWLPLSALGLGYRTMTAWMVDLASRLFERYGHLANPLEGAAVCLIDEIDLHLHPVWQRELVDLLTALFPQTQFIATAHSPLIVQASEDVSVVVLQRNERGVVIENAPVQVRKWRLDQILTSELFGLPSARPKALDALLNERDAILAKADLSESDESRLRELRAQIGQLPFGETPEDVEAMDIIRQAAHALDGREKGG